MMRDGTKEELLLPPTPPVAEGWITRLGDGARQARFGRQAGRLSVNPKVQNKIAHRILGLGPPGWSESMPSIPLLFYGGWEAD